MTPGGTTLEEMKSGLAELREELSRQRKQGKDTLIAQLKVMPIQAKLKMAEITQSDRDIAVVGKMLDEAKKELKTGTQAQPQPPPMPEAEENLNKVKDYIERAKEAAMHGKKEEASVLYQYAQEHYKLLSSGQKKLVAQELK